MFILMLYVEFELDTCVLFSIQFHFLIFLGLGDVILYCWLVVVCVQLYNEELFDLLDVTKDPVDKVCCMMPLIMIIVVIVIVEAVIVLVCIILSSHIMLILKSLPIAFLYKL